MRAGSTEWTFSSIYIPCGSTGPALRPDLEKLNGTQNIIVGGDLNARHTSWCTDTNTTGVVLRKWLDNLDTSFTLVSPDKPTYNKSKLDHFLVPTDDIPLQSTAPMVTQTFADHDAITWVYTTSDKWETKTTKNPLDYTRTNWDDFD